MAIGRISRYRRTTRVTRGGQTYLATRVRPPYPPAGDDAYYDVEPYDTYQELAYRFFGDVRLYWIILDFNPELDPFEEPGGGTTIRLPSQRRLWMEVLA